MLKKDKTYEKLWVVFEHGKMVLFGFVSWGFNVIVVCFRCVWHSSRSVKNACFFPSFGAFVGWFILVYFGFGRFRRFVFLVFVFVFCVAFVSVLFALFLFCCWIVFWYWFLFCFSFCFFVLLFFFFFFFFSFCFFGGFKGQVRWPKGPPHLALKPPFLVFVFLFCVVLFFLEGLRVRWGGPKGHLTWP